MRNHADKQRDMSRSVLPSTSRVEARNGRRRAHRTQRAGQRAALHAGGERREARLGDAEGRRRRELNAMVADRRSADKVGPLVRWARVTVERDPALRDADAETIRAHFAALLPDDLIGRHAVQHIMWGLGLRFPDYQRVHEQRLARCRAADAEARRRYRAGLTTLLDDGRHGELNAELRQRTEQLTPRLLLGRHDVEAFADETEHDPYKRAVVEDLLTWSG